MEMDRKSDKLSIGRKKLRKFQARNPPVLSTPPAERMSSTEGLRELTHDISSLLSDGTISLSSPQKNGLQVSPQNHLDNNIPTLTLPTLIPPSTPSTDTQTDSVGTKPHPPTTHTTGIHSLSTTGETRTTAVSSTSPRLLPASGNVGEPQLTSPVSTSTGAEVYSVKPSTDHKSNGSLTSFSSGKSGISGLTSSHQTPNPPSIPQPSSLRTSLSTNDQGFDQSPPTSRLFTVNGVGGSGLSSAMSSLNPSARSSFSNLQLLGETPGTEYVANRTGIEYRNRPSDTSSDLDSLVKAHAQTIDILVSEKTTLQTELSTVKAQLSAKTKECSDFQVKLREFSNKFEELQRERASLTEELSRSTQALAQSHTEHHEVRESVRRLRGTLEDQQQENTELISKITSQSAELTRLQSSNTELQSKLKMAELLTQQLSGGSVPQATPPQPDPSHKARLRELESETSRLNRNVYQLTLERDQAYSDLDALRESLVEQQEQQAQKLSVVESQLAKSEEVVKSLREELEALQQENSDMKQRVATEHAQTVHSSQVAKEAVQREKDTLQNQLERLFQEKSDLKRLSEEQEERIEELEFELSRLKEQSVDQQSLLTTITQDKEAVSRAMSQNKELKTNLAELQDAFVRLSQQNMELASDLETERLRVAQLKVHPPPAESEGNPPFEAPTQAISTEKVSSEESDQQTQELRNQLQAVLSENTELQSNLVQWQSEHQNLYDRFNQLQTDRSNLSHQLAELQASYSTLSEEHQSAIHQLEGLEEQERKETEQVDYQPELELMDVHNMSADELTLLQHNFGALQQKFVHLVSEKVELLEKLQENEHLIVQLSYETETIGDYITLYQAQRDALKSRFKEKDQCIEQLMQEKSSMQVKLHELQALVRQVLSERGGVPSQPTVEHKPRPPPTVSVPTQSHTSSDLPLHLRPQSKVTSVDVHEHHLESFIEEQLNDSPRNTNNSHMTLDDSHAAMNTSHASEDMSHVTFGESQVTVDGDSFVSTATTEQILHLLDELDTEKAPPVHIPCRVCVGPVLHV